jgi:hypothetical protein
MDLVFDMFEAGFSRSSIATILSIDRSTVSRRLQKFGIQTSKRRYSLNESFFHHISTASQAYWLGFLLADGTISRNRSGNPNYLTITLQARDKNHLSLLASCLHYSGRVTDLIACGVQDRQKQHAQARIRITSVNLCRDLMDFGWGDFKTRGNTTILDKLPVKLQKHMVRGLVDGDGGFSVYQRKNRNYTEKQFFFCDRFASVVDWMARWLEKNANVSRSKLFKAPKANVYMMTLSGGRQVRRIAQKLYNGRSIALQRKAKLAVSI